MLERGRVRINEDGMRGHQQREDGWGAWAVRWGMDAEGKWWAYIGKLSDLGGRVVEWKTQRSAEHQETRAHALELVARRFMETHPYNTTRLAMISWMIGSATLDGLPHHLVHSLHDMARRWEERARKLDAMPAFRL